MHIKQLARITAPSILLVAALAACSSGTSQPSAAATAPSTPATSATASASPSTTDSATPEVREVPVAKVRDSFAVLQATYTDPGCAASEGNCEYFLKRVLDNLNALDASMKASSEGPAHFKQPLAWINQMRTTLAGDSSFPNLKSHQALLTGTRDKINTWMQSHPEDYR
jgi:ABC-type transport system substrate-binding protein